jgi:hypothetical protein
VPLKPDIYYVSRQGLGVLLSQGLITDDEAAPRSREHELKPQTLDHEMTISDLHLMLKLATRGSGLELIFWKDGGAVRDTFEVVKNGLTKSITIAPDAFFQLKNTELNGVQSFFLEADRSSMPNAPRTGVSGSATRSSATWRSLRRGDQRHGSMRRRSES